MNKKEMRLISAVLALVMVLGVLATLPFTASAYASNDTTAPGTGTALPEGAEAYGATGTPSTELAGTGTEENPYQIANASDFVYFRNTMAAEATADTYFVLTGDIYLNDANYGTSGKHLNFDANGPLFYGTFDGAGHTIYNMYSYVSTHENRYIGIFHTLYGTVKNLTVDGVHFVSSWADQERHRFGVIAATNAGTIENATAKNVYMKSNSSMGGISAYANGGAQFINCTTYGVIESSKGSSGGILGVYADISVASPVSFINCTNNIKVTSSNTAAGGILGSVFNDNYPYGVIMRDCTNNADITAPTKVGGMIGENYRAITVLKFEYCKNNGAITATATANSFAGGLVGIMRNGGNSGSAPVVVTGCTNMGKVSGGVYSGGMFGQLQENYATSTTFTDCANYGDVDGITAAGGFIGSVFRTITLTNCANYGNIGGATLSAGAICGEYKTSTTNINGFLSTGNITAATNAGVLFGKLTVNNTTLPLVNVWATGTCTAGTYAGAFAGATNKDTATPTFTVTGGGFDVELVIGEAPADLVSYYMSNGTSVLAYNSGAAACPVANPETFTADALTALNKLASTGYNPWVADDTYGIVFKALAFSILNPGEMSHGYNGTRQEIQYAIIDSQVVKVVATYYDMTTGSPVALDEAPMLPGSYRVVAQGYDANNEAYGAANEVDYTITKGDLYFRLVSDHSNLKFTKTDLWYPVYGIFEGTFTGELADFVVQIVSPDGTVFAELKSTKYQRLKDGTTTWVNYNAPILHYGTYKYSYDAYSYAGDELHNPFSIGANVFKAVINKSTFAYPAADAETTWDIPVFDGTEKQPTLNSVAGEPSMNLFDITYGGDYKAVCTPDGVVLTATATLTLKAEFANDCTMTGDAPTYTVEWSLAPSLSFAGASMSLGESMALNLKVDAATLAYFASLGDMTLTFIKDGVKVIGTYTADVQIGPDGEEHTYYTFAFDGISVADFATAAEYSFSITVGDDTYTNTKLFSYAPIDYAVALYRAQAEQNEELKNLLVSMLTYASMAEKNISATANTIADRVKADLAIDLATEVTTENTNHMWITDADIIEKQREIINGFVESGAALTGYVNLLFKVKDDSAVNAIRVTASFLDGAKTFEKNEAGYITIACLNAATVRDQLTFEFLDAEGNALTYTDEAGETYTSAYFSMGNYLQRLISGEPTLKNLASSMVNYMMAVRAYAKPMAN